eukprot:UN12664
MSFDSRPTAVVTGASKGIGASIAEKLLSQGWNVCLLARSRDKMERIASKYNPDQSLIIECDLKVRESLMNGCKKIISWTPGYLNLLINNAGFAVNPSEMDVSNPLNDKVMMQSIKEWDDHFNVLLHSPMIFIKYFIHLLKNASLHPIKNKYGIYDGSIINVSSTASSVISMPVLTPYSVSKAALNQLTRLNAFELSGKYGIRCNGLITGAIKTTIFETSGWTKKALSDLVSLIPGGTY